MPLYFILRCAGEETVNVHIGASYGDEQGLGSVYSITTSLENVVPTEEETGKN